MKIFFRKPSVTKVASLLRRFEPENPCYRGMGSTKSWTIDEFTELPNPRVVKGDHLQFRRTQIGRGARDFETASTGIHQGICFDLGWVNIQKSEERPWRQGDTFCVLAKAFGIWTASFCRVVYIVSSETVTEKTLSLGIGTLSCHAAAGEERFSIVWDLESNRIELLLGSYSRPNTWLSKLFVTYLRRQQRRFATDSHARMQFELSTSGPEEWVQKHGFTTTH